MKRLIILAVLFLAVSSCYNDKYDKLYPNPTTTVTCDTSAIKYSQDILPIITANCTIAGGCHDAAGAATSGFDYSGSVTVLQGNAASGALVTDITWQPTRGHNNMPKNLPKLSDCDINKITRWVNEGAPNN